MTDEQFDDWYATLTEVDKMEWLFKQRASVNMVQGAIYGLNVPSDWEAMIQQEMYREKTGRE